MSKSYYVRDKPHMNIGTIGHVDHGKTTLTSAITKVLAECAETKFIPINEIDAAPEERERAMSINATKVNYKTKARHYAHIDCPGHADFVENMIAGANQIECAILVVSGADGPMSQTREHLILAKQIGIEKLVVFINKADAVEDEILELVRSETKDTLKQCGFDSDNIKIISGSAKGALEGNIDDINNNKIIELIETIDNMTLPKREVDKPFYLPIDDVFTITGRGTVVSGRIERGIIKPQTSVEIKGYDNSLKSVVTSVETFGQILYEPQTGDQVSLLLDLKNNELRRGMIVGEPNSLEMYNYIDAQVYMLNKTETRNRDEPFANNCQLQIFSKCWVCPAFLILNENQEKIMPGEESEIKLHFMKFMVLEEGQRFIIRDGITLGYGTVKSLLPDPGL